MPRKAAGCWALLERQSGAGSREAASTLGPALKGSSFCRATFSREQGTLTAPSQQQGTHVQWPVLGKPPCPLPSPSAPGPQLSLLLPPGPHTTSFTPSSSTAQGSPTWFPASRGHTHHAAPWIPPGEPSLLGQEGVWWAPSSGFLSHGNSLLIHLPVSPHPPQPTWRAAPEAAPRGTCTEGRPWMTTPPVQHCPEHYRSWLFIILCPQQVSGWPIKRWGHQCS